MTVPDDQATRLEALERQVSALSAEVAELRARGGWAGQSTRPADPVPAMHSDYLPPELLQRLRSAGPASPSRMTGFTGDEIESFVGRYGTVLAAALAMLMGVGVLVEVAVARGLLTATVRVALGALVALAVGGAGLYFRRRGELRYGDVLLSIALAIVDLVAWGAGPRLHIVPSAFALVVVDVVAVGIGLLALHDENEFLFAVAVGGALSAPFVTSTGGGTVAMLLAYGTVVLLGALRVVHDASWRRAFAVLVAGTAIYMLAAAAMKTGAGWYEPYLVVGFGGVIAAAALLIAPERWRAELPRVVLFLSLIGVAAFWDHAASASVPVAAAVALALVALTYAALGVRPAEPTSWVVSALVLPLVSLGVAAPVADAHQVLWPVLALWAAFAMAAWQFERGRAEPERAGAHLLASGLLGGASIAVALWPHPLPLVVGLGAWGVVLAALSARETSPLPLVAVAFVLGGACLSAIDQLTSRLAYAYTPFMTRSSLSALVATVALTASAVLMTGEEETTGSSAAPVERWANRPLRLGIVIGFAILWGRLELGHAFSRDLSTFLLILYYASCGLAIIVTGRRLAIQRLRVAGLILALYAAVKAMVEVAAIDGVLLRVGSYGAVGLFLLGAGYLYRARQHPSDTGKLTPAELG